MSFQILYGLSADKLFRMVPPFDHTSSSTYGGVAYIVKSGFSASQLAQFDSPTYNKAHSTCKVREGNFWLCRL